MPPRRPNSAHPSIVPFQNFAGRRRLARGRRRQAEVLGAALRGDRQARSRRRPALRDDGRSRRAPRRARCPILDEAFRSPHRRRVARRARRAPASRRHGSTPSRRRSTTRRRSRARTSSSTSTRRSAACARSARRCASRRAPSARARAGARAVPRRAHRARCSSSCAGTRPSGCASSPGGACSGTIGVTGRDLVGYGAQPPDPRWPGGARVALSFVLNYEEGGEHTPLEGDPASEAFLHEVVGAPPTVGRRNLNTESMFEFGSRAGFWRVHRIFTAHGAAADGVRGRAGARAEPRTPRARWSTPAGRWRATAGAGSTTASVVRGRGARPRAPLDRGDRAGLRRPTGRLVHGPRVARRRGGSSSRTGASSTTRTAYADELPYWVDVAGRDHLVDPVHARRQRLQVPARRTGSSPPATSRVPGRLARPAAGGGRPHDVGRAPLPHRRAARTRTPALDRFLEHVRAHDDVWVTTRADIARHWHAEHRRR